MNQKILLKMTKIHKLILLACCFFLTFSCDTLTEVQKELNNVMEEDRLTEDEVARGLKEALITGTSKGTQTVSKVDGYFMNPKIKIPFPPNAVKVENKLRDIGLGSEVDKVVKTLNRAAEEAAKEAKPIFVSAIKQMTIRDAWEILRGPDDAATEYLKRTTSDQLRSKFRPVVDNALDKTNATKYWNDVISTYNKIPLVEKMNPDLNSYVTGKAMEGLFYMVEQEEGKIRKDPAARATDLLKRVFDEKHRQ